MPSARRFEILDGETVIGTTAFEGGDCSMGVAYGDFVANAEYRPEHTDPRGNLTARVNGRLIPSAGGVGIEDMFEEIGERGVTIFGVDHQLYAELFPEHVAAYEALYPKRSAPGSRMHPRWLKVSNGPSGRYDTLMNKIVVTAAWLALLVIAFVTLGPIGLRPVSGTPPQLERAIAFFVLGLLFALAYPRQIWWAVALVVCATFGLELLQNLTPDRHGREADALAKFAGAALGLSLGWLSIQIMASRRGDLHR